MVEELRARACSRVADSVEMGIGGAWDLRGKDQRTSIRSSVPSSSECSLVANPEGDAVVLSEECRHCGPGFWPAFLEGRPERPRRCGCLGHARTDEVHFRARPRSPLPFPAPIHNHERLRQFAAN